MQLAPPDSRLTGLVLTAPLAACHRPRDVHRRWMWASGISILVHATTALALVVTSQRDLSRPFRASFAGQARHVQIEVNASMSLVASTPVHLAQPPEDIVVRPDEVKIAQQHYRLTETQSPVVSAEPVESEQPSAVAPEVMRPQRQAMREPHPDVTPRTVEFERQRPVAEPVLSSAAAVAALARDQNLSQGTNERIRPRFVSNRPPRYPEQARQRGWQGTVYLRLKLDEQGQVVQVQVERSSGHPVLDAEAVNAVRQWHAEPAQQNGRPVASEELLPVRFELADDNRK